MRKIIAIIVPLLLACIVFFVFEYFANKSSDKGALQVTSTPASNVYVNGAYVGKTPICKCDLPNMLPIGNYSISLVPIDTQYSAYEDSISITKSVLTVVDRTFGKGAFSEGSIIGLTPLPDKNAMEIIVQTVPDKVHVMLDNISQGDSPQIIKNVTASDHEIELSKDGYREKIIRIHTVSGYQLIAKVYLSVNPNPTSSQQKVSTTPTPSVSTTPTASTSQIIILQTPTGYLRVHSTASTQASEVGRVNPGDTFPLIDQKTGWFEITLTDGTKGWVSSQYAKIK